MRTLKVLNGMGLAESEVLVGEVIPNEHHEFRDERGDHVMDGDDFGSKPDERGVEPEPGEIDGDETRVLAELVRPRALEGEFLVDVERGRSHRYEADDDGFEVVQAREFGQDIQNDQIRHCGRTSDEEELEKLRELREEAVQPFDMRHSGLLKKFVPYHLGGDVHGVG